MKTFQIMSCKNKSVLTNKLISQTRPRLHDSLGSGGRPLDLATQQLMGVRFKYNFDDVKIHTDDNAKHAARSINARSYTLGKDIVFGNNQYAPGTPTGKHLLAHELTHVVQQDNSGNKWSSGKAMRLGNPSSLAEQEAHHSANNILAGRSVEPKVSVESGTIQREEGDDEESAFRLQWPGVRQSAFPRLTLAPELRLELDPELQARIAAMRIVREMLEPEDIRSSLLRIDINSLLANQPPPWLTTPGIPEPAPLVPRGTGPSTPRPGSAGDVLRAVLRIPSVNTALTNLRTEAAGQARRHWRQLSTGERVLVISQSALIAGGALAGVLSSPEGREFSLDLIQNRNIPIPGVPGLTFQFNATGSNRMIQFNLNVGALLPPSLGFR